MEISEKLNKGTQSVFLIPVIFLLGLTLVSCSNSTSSYGGGGSTDNTYNGGNGGGNDIGTEPTFTNIQQIFQRSCAGSGCHVGETTSGVSLDDYQSVIESVGDQYGEKIISPGNPGSSPLVDKIESNPQNGVRMPNGGSPLSDDRISQIREWISNGAQNN